MKIPADTARCRSVFCAQIGSYGDVTTRVVIPTKAKPRGGIYVFIACTADYSCEDPSTSLRSARDDSLGGDLKRSDKLKFESLAEDREGECEKSRDFSKVFVDFFGNVSIINFRMDTKKVCMISECGNLAELSKNKVVVGAKQLRKALEKGTAKFVCLAKNADPAITEPIASKCLALNVPCSWVSTMQELGSACGIDVGAAAAAAVES